MAFSAGLDGEREGDEKEHRGEGGERGQALARVAGHGGRVTRGGWGPQEERAAHGGQDSRVRNFNGLGCGR